MVLLSVLYVISIFNLYGILLMLYNCKKIIGLFSILHMSLFVVSLIVLELCSLLSGIIVSISHGLCSIGKFWVVGVLMSKVYMNWLDIFILISKYMLVLVISLLICNLSYPVSYNWLGEMLSYVCVMVLDVMMCVLVMFISMFISSFYWFLVLNRNVLVGLSCRVYSVFEYVVCFKVNLVLFILFLTTLF